MRRYIYHPQIYILTTVQHSKFNKEERKYIMKQSLNLTSLQESPNINNFKCMYKSQNMFFFITKEPQCSINP